MPDIIRNIKEVEDFLVDSNIIKGIDIKNSYFEGYIIESDNYIIHILISNDTQCCENYGYIVSEDNINNFIGAELIKISKIDSTCNAKDINLDELDLDSGEAMFINLETSKGLLQFAVYNSHNGYYGHNAFILIYNNSFNNKSNDLIQVQHKIL